jgi:hypothetical protein
MIISSEEVELIGGFIQMARLGRSGDGFRANSKDSTWFFELTKTLHLLEEGWFYVFGGREKHQVKVE